MKWKGKSAEELTDSIQFFRDIVTGPFEKFIMVTIILPLMGQQYSEKVADNCVAASKAMGIYTEAKSKVVEEFIQVFKDEIFPPGSSILYGSIPKVENATIANKPLSQAVLESIIGKHGVSLEAKHSLAVRISEQMKNQGDTLEEGAAQKVENGEPVKIYPLPN